MIKELSYIILNYSVPCAYQHVFHNNEHYWVSATIVNTHKYCNHENIGTRKYYNYREINKRKYYSIYGENGVYNYPLPQRYTYTVNRTHCMEK